MARGPTTFRQRDLTAALKAVAASRCPVARVRVLKDGEIVVEIGAPAEMTISDDNKNEWDSP